MNTIESTWSQIDRTIEDIHDNGFYTANLKTAAETRDAKVLRNVLERDYQVWEPVIMKYLYRLTHMVNSLL